MAKLPVPMNDVDPAEGGNFKTWPQGEYRLMATEVNQRTNESTGVVRLWLKCVCLEGEREGRSIGDGFNLVHPNSAKAQRIGQERFKALLVATGLADIPDEAFDDQMLLNRPFLAYIKRKKLPAEQQQWGDEDGYRNEFDSFSADEGGSAPAGDDAPPPPPVGDDGEIPF